MQLQTQRRDNLQYGCEFWITRQRHVQSGSFLWPWQYLLVQLQQTADHHLEEQLQDKPQHPRPIARASMDSEFRDAIANGTNITWVVQL
jgi:hypothetical protein